jgi:hypothetical protein
VVLNAEWVMVLWTFALGTMGGEERSSQGHLKEVPMRLVKRFAVAISSLLALALAGGAHWRL